MDVDTLEPIAGAKVRLTGRVVDPRRDVVALNMTAFTNSRGDYAFAGVPPVKPGTGVTEVAIAPDYGRYTMTGQTFKAGHADARKGAGYGGQILLSNKPITLRASSKCPCGTGQGELANTGDEVADFVAAIAIILVGVGLLTTARRASSASVR
jgi:hypothetical protein